MIWPGSSLFILVQYFNWCVFYDLVVACSKGTTCLFEYIFNTLSADWHVLLFLIFKHRWYLFLYCVEWMSVALIGWVVTVFTLMLTGWRSVTLWEWECGWVDRWACDLSLGDCQWNLLPNRFHLLPQLTGDVSHRVGGLVKDDAERRLRILLCYLSGSWLAVCNIQVQWISASL